MIVYTANFGNKDKLKDHWVNSGSTEFVYFTDHHLGYSKWDMRVQDGLHKSSVRTARWYKTHSHELFPGETTCWVDANLIVKKDPADLSDKYDHLLVQKHPFRFDLFEEADYCLRKKKGKTVDVMKQASFYWKKYRADSPELYNTRIVLRKPTEEVRLLNEKWWEQMVHFSTRDQISLPYVIWKYNIPHNTVDVEEMKTYFYKRGGHRFRGNEE